jgi:hypothetical protein
LILRSRPASARSRGESRSRLNAGTAGLAARTLIPPGEDARECQRRLAAWTADLSPCNPFEEDVVRRAVGFSWRLDPADRIQAELMAERFATVPVEEERRRGGEDLGHPTS